VLWARKKPGWEKFEADLGLALSLDERKGVTWTIDPKTGSSKRSVPRQSEREIEMCARCHARRSPITEGYVHGDRFTDHYIPNRLDEGLYFADGQIDGEVYVYGSFLQSRMYQAGVTCSDCHEPHDLSLRAPGNGVCLQCHRADKYDAKQHHHHPLGSPGASCAECHMPPRSYMVVDPRHDHSMRIPRPDLSVRLGTPNACNQCHKDKPYQWSADQVTAWYGDTPKGIQRYAQTLHDARDRNPKAGSALAALIRDTQTPDIARATAIAAVGTFLDRSNADVLQIGLADEDPLVRAATLSALESAPLAAQVRFAWPLLSDPVRAVRIEAARLLAAVPLGELDDDKRTLLDAATGEYLGSQLAMAERPEAQANLGNLYAAKGEVDAAVAAYREAMALDPRFSPAYMNLADLYRHIGDETGAEGVLRQGIAVYSGSGDLHHALGLSLVRQKRMPEALAELQQATRLNPENARYVYVYAVALNTTGNPKEALMVLQGAHNAHPNDTDILSALVAFHRDEGNSAQAARYAQKLKLLRQ
jgi:predicted CXXCH cytochrome family protein